MQSYLIIFELPRKDSPKTHLCHKNNVIFTIFHDKSPFLSLLLYNFAPSSHLERTTNNVAIVNNIHYNTKEI